MIDRRDPFQGQVAAFLPPAAPFDAQARARLDAVLGVATPVQLAWLGGFLSGRDARIPDAPAPAGVPLTILFASESGNCEMLAHRAAKLARKRGFKPRVVDFADLDIAALPTMRILLVVAATWGEGEPPARAASAFATLMGETAPRLDGVQFGVLGLGDTSYAEFCAIGRLIDERLAALGATRVLDRADCDLDFEAPAAAWIDSALALVAPAIAVPASVASFAEAEDDVRREVEAEVVDHVNLNSSRSDKETIHLALGFADTIPPYAPGDSLVDEILAGTGQSGDDGLRRALLTERDITTLSAITVERLARIAGHTALGHMVESGGTKDWIAGRQLIDLLTAYPATLSAQQMMDITRKLPPRAYSIASSRHEFADEAHLLVASVRYRSHGRARAGVASTYVADRLKPGARVKVRLKPNPHFRLPADPATDIVMIGPGTGVAPFRAFVQERRAIGASGRSWLFFGDRHFTHDFLYQLEWQEALAEGSLTRLDVAFSRDQPEKLYVQHRLFAQRHELVDWIENGASLYVCGDAKAMAKDVRTSLVRAWADVKSLSLDAAESAIARLERDRRYLQDVY